jgi:hypothetical protein
VVSERGAEELRRAQTGRSRGRLKFVVEFRFSRFLAKTCTGAPALGNRFTRARGQRWRGAPALETRGRAVKRNSGFSKGAL